MVLHKSQSPVSQALFYAFLKSPQGLRRLVDFLGIKKASTNVKALIRVIPKGFEPLTHRLEICCSIQLSYETINIQKKRQ